MSKEPIMQGAESLVQRQLDAYNTRDIEAFIACWSEDCEYYEFPNRLLAAGASEVRERHVLRFREPNLFGRLIRRSAVDNLVVDQELVTRNFAEGVGEVDVLAIYQIEHGRIAKAWFKIGMPRLHTANG